MSTSADQQRAAMLAEVSRGAASSGSAGDASGKWLLGRGCDPAMALQSTRMLPPLLGNVNMHVTTDDDEFLKRLNSQKYDVVFFAPGACRWSQAKQPIPGGNSITSGWSLEQYHALVKQVQGNSVVIVGTAEERLIVPLLRKALLLDS